MAVASREGFEFLPSGIDPKRSDIVDLAIWIPGLFLLGIVTLGLMVAFVIACDKV